MAETLRLKRPVIAITGSAGKSTTKEMIAAILSTRWRIFKSADNWNFYTHTQKYRRQIGPNHRAVVLEYGMSGAGHIRKHCKIIQPNYGVITNIGTAHIGAFGGDVKKLARAKSELIRYMKPTGTIVINRDDPNTKLMDKGNFHGRTITFGIHNEAVYRGSNVRYAAGGMAFDLKTGGGKQTFYIPISGRHHVYNALAAIAVARTLGFRYDEIRMGLRRFRRMARRMTIRRFSRSITVIDDSFSSNPNAAIAAIDTLSQVGKGSKIAVLGSMLALGKYAVRGHQEVGRHIAKKGIAHLFTIGRFTPAIGNAAIRAGFPKSRVHHFTDRSALHRKLVQTIGPNTTILVKGSHAAGMTLTADFLTRRLGNPSATGKTKPVGVKAKVTDRGVARKSRGSTAMRAVKGAKLRRQRKGVRRRSAVS
ncbi:UDP-N-acetylmuramoyl-tripeptide--D-alanyl-D-alanine ligase [Alicyclobacillus ferrooxydans]|uniref:UDP-N-acetylmuramoyl-tripeptide--D-alanyl-D- alanine ligase n=1 Tax=Alicyclobacillus ferrooxydans TaxID=471514 RepID=UPI0009FA0171|nr:UDP-N-acetylmuramoyl-tripeptide--D-alanyl-D-alanine ligase [Alicyclobacillus ferrooxydans]